MKEIKIKLPASIKECGADIMYKWMLVSDTISTINEKSLTEILEFHCQLVSIFSGMAINKVKRAVPDSIMEASKHIFTILSQYEKQEPQEVIEIEGKKFRLEKNFGHVTTGQIIDLKLIDDISADPWAPLAIMYVEDGMEYCQEDDRGRVLNPNDVRHKLFKEHFPGDEFLNFYAFFLDILQERKLAILGIQIARMKMQKMMLEQELQIQIGLSGQESSIDYPKRWDAVWTELQSNPM
jgi:hypothetical protein